MSKTMRTLLGVLAMTVAGCWCKSDPCEHRDDEARGRRGAWHRLHDDEDEDEDEACITDGGAASADATGAGGRDAATRVSSDAPGSVARDAGAAASDAGGATPDACSDPAPPLGP